MKELTIIGKIDEHSASAFLKGDSGGDKDDWSVLSNVLRIRTSSLPLIWDETNWDDSYWDE